MGYLVQTHHFDDKPLAVFAVVWVPAYEVDGARLVEIDNGSVSMVEGGDWIACVAVVSLASGLT